MGKLKIVLSSINDVKQFVTAAAARPCDIDVVSGRYIIDAKSIMGIFSIDLSKPVSVEVHGTDEDLAEFKADVEQFIIVEEDGEDD